MPTRNSSKASLTKKLQNSALAVLIFLALVTLAANGILFAIKGRFSGRLIPQLIHRFSVGAAFYLPPNFLILKNTSFADPSAERDALVRIAWVTAQVDLSESIRSRMPVLSNISCYGVEAQEVSLLPFLKENLTGIIDYLRELPVRDLRMRVQRARFDSRRQRGRSRRYLAQGDLEVSGGVIRIKGFSDIVQYADGKDEALPLAPLSFDGSIVSVPGGFVLESGEISRENLYLKTWGRYEDDLVTLHGFVFMNSSFRQEDYSARPGSWFRRLKRAVAGQRPAIPKLALADADLFVLDVDGRFRMDLPRIAVEKASFSVNNIPVTVSGAMVIAEKTSLDYLLTVDLAKGPAQPHTGVLKKITCVWKGEALPEAVTGSAELRLAFSRDEAARTPEDAVIRLNGGVYRFTDLPVYTLSFRSAEVRCATAGGVYQAVLDKPVFAFKSIGDEALSIGYSSGFARGRINARTIVEWDDYPWRIESLVRVRGADAHSLQGVLVHFSKVHGDFFSQMKFQTSPSARLVGSMCINAGYVEDLAFFKWLSDQFKIPSLRRVEFGKVSMNFSAQRSESRMYDLYLDSTDVELSGFFTLNSRNLVSSTLSLSLSNPVLNESPRFQRIVRVMRDADVESLRFDFQLSGILGAMNFKWMESDFKKELQRRIPNFIERRIEQGVEELIAAPSG